MTMEVVAVCRSRKKMRPKAAAILDRYLFRVGDRTWKGRASRACLRRLSTDLKAIASRNMAVAVHRARSSSTLEAPMFVIGSKSRFSPSGVVPISVRRSHRRQREAGELEKGEELIVGLAALMHDVGKCTKAFQAKLWAAVDPKKKTGGVDDQAKMPDAVRHEVFSAFFFDALCKGLAPGDHKGLSQRIATALGEPARFEEAAKSAAKRCQNLVKGGSAESPIEFFMDISDPEFPLPTVLLLILTHHRLPWTDTRCRELKAKHHANFERKVDRDSFSISSDCAIWVEEDWLSDLRRIGERMAVMENLRLVRGDIHARTGLMLGDHVGSHEKRGSALATGALANTLIDDAGVAQAADSVPVHTRRVYKASKAAIRMMHESMNNLPALGAEECPVPIREPSPGPDRFAWQGAAAREAARISGTAPGGFFGCILAGTGTGKTRGAPTILANAAFSDPDPCRRDLRYNLALGLRTLAHQSAKEYVSDLGFAAEDIAVLVGGETISWEEDESDNALDKDLSGESVGSEQRFEAISGVRTERPRVDEEDLDFSALGLDCERDLPAFMDRVIEAARDKGPMIRRLMASPLVVATIDHLMPAADARRSWHLSAMLRLASSDMIIDEIDQFSEEDLMAIERLVEIIGAFGRRLIIMSATLPPDIAEQMYSAYRRGYSDHCRRTKKGDDVHVLVAGDRDDLVASGTNPVFSDVFEDMVSRVCEDLRARDPLRKARILAPVEDWGGLVRQVFSEVGDLHERLASRTKDGFRISAGLVRMTRVKHAQDLAVGLATMKEDGIHREYVVVHSRLPQIQRSWIEHRLRRALTRKGQDPDCGLRALLEREGVFKRAAAAGKRDIALVVISSPVIETGNDVDFDYAIIDPSSLRAVVQTAGRVMRHRGEGGGADNIMIFNEYCVSRFEGGVARNPGVETDPCEAVSSVSLDDCTGRDAISLIGEWNGAPVDATILIDQARPSQLRAKEEELRCNYRSCRPSEANRGSRLARWSAKRPVDLMFRRTTFGESTAFPVMSQSGDLTWWELAGRRRNRKVESGLVESASASEISTLLSEDLLQLLQKRRGEIPTGRMMMEGGISFFPVTGGGVVSGIRDPSLGVLKPLADPS